jgi:hypothetical protein
VIGKTRGDVVLKNDNRFFYMVVLSLPPKKIIIISLSPRGAGQVCWSICRVLLVALCVWLGTVIFDSMYNNSYWLVKSLEKMMAKTFLASIREENPQGSVHTNHSMSQ